jgi:hypothetical protein
MDEDTLLKTLRRQTKSTLLELLHSAYYETNTQQRHSIFGDLMTKTKLPKMAGKDIAKKSKAFYKDSLAGAYYAPFNINSKNFSYIPEETEEWFDKLGDLLKSSTELTKQGDHISAIESFSILYELICKMEYGEEIIFADEYGSWMIPGNEKEYLGSYIKSLAKVKKPQEYVNAVIPLIQRDSVVSFCNKVYSAAVRHGDKEQDECLKAEIKRENVKVTSER